MLLRPLTVEDEVPALRAHDELAADDFSFLLDTTPDQTWPAYVARLAQIDLGLDLAPDRVRMTFLVADVDGEIVGRTSIRHELNDHLAAFGGHIGYGVRPEFRRRGYATEILRQSLRVAREAGVASALLCCDDANAASATVIERCGGVLENVVDGGPGGRTRRYWVATS